ncbi:MAG TPA: hypothetical protein VF796_30755, partial [Humisphaera sp.]
MSRTASEPSVVAPSSDRSWPLPPLGDNPSTEKQGTTPGSFANRGAVGTPTTYSSPDAPGMPPASPFTAWDFLPEGWQTFVVPAGEDVEVDPGDADSRVVRIVEPDGSTRVVVYPRAFVPVTQL